ncbi:MAG TPA: hypothetical protein VJH65_00280, partial [Candidatus Nanoarchaeia archaeon]|nr:hypothetical protein [Candidatus Nanoarchaeia archaeon]
IEVGKATNNLRVSIPHVKFWDSYENHFDKSERAHIHLEDNLICIAEPELEIMSEEDIRITATHEVSHLHHIDHGVEFQKTHENLELGAWQPPAGTIGALPENYKLPKKEKEREQRAIKYKCNFCDKRKKTKKCVHCGGYFCEEHIKPIEPYIGIISESRYRVDEKNTHSCFPYSKYLIKKKEKEDEEYSKTLDNLLKKKKKEDSFSDDEFKVNNIKLNLLEQKQTKEKKHKFTDRFFLSPIASFILIISLVLYFITDGWLWPLLVGISLIYIIFKWLDFEIEYKV